MTHIWSFQLLYSKAAYCMGVHLTIELYKQGCALEIIDATGHQLFREQATTKFWDETIQAARGPFKNTVGQSNLRLVLSPPPSAQGHTGND